VRRFHRGNDGYVTLHRKPEPEKWENLGSLRADELEELFPSIRKSLVNDSYFGINSHYRNLKRGNAGTLRYLNACFVDLDAYNVPPAKALGRLMEEVGAFTIPAPSIFGLSGRGVWCFWLLRDPDDPELPQKAFPEKRLVFTRVQRAMYQRVKKLLPELKPDANALDLVRVTRIPGSLNTKAGEEVLHFASLDHDGKLRTYTLVELAAHFDVEERLPAPAPPIARTGRRVPARRAGWDARWTKALQFFKTLQRLRGGGFEEGTRNVAAWCYAFLLTRAGHPEHEIWERVGALAESCRPPLPQPEVVSVVLSIHPAAKRHLIHPAAKRHLKRHLSMATLAAKLDVTEEEAAALAPFMPKPRRPRENKRQARVEARRKRVREIAEELGEVPTTAELARVLKLEGYPGSSVEIVNRDLLALGMRSPRKRRPRRWKKILECLPF